MPDDLGCRQAFLPTARKRHDTVSAEFIAAFDYRDKCNKGGMTVSIGDRPIIVVFPFAHVKKIPAASRCFINRVGYAADRFCAYHKIYAVNLFEEGFAFQLGHAAHNADNWLFALRMSYVAHACEQFMFGTLPNGA